MFAAILHNSPLSYCLLSQGAKPVSYWQCAQAADFLKKDAKPHSSDPDVLGYMQVVLT